MKVKILRVDGMPFWGKKKVLTFNICNFFETLSNASRKDWEVIELEDNKWAVIYSSSSMEEGEHLEFQFSYNYFGERALIPRLAIHWKKDRIEDDYNFTVVVE